MDSYRLHFISTGYISPQSMFGGINLHNCFFYLIFLISIASNFTSSYYTCMIARKHFPLHSYYRLLSSKRGYEPVSHTHSYQTITSKSNAHVALIQSLKIKKYRDKHHLVLLEGHRQITDAFHSGMSPHLVIVTSAALQAPLGKNLSAMMEKISYDALRMVDDSIMSSISETVTSQGVVAAFAIPPQPSIDEIIESSYHKPSTLSRSPLLLVADNISDPGNMGTLIRSAYGFGVDAMLLIGGCDVWSPKVIRASMGTCLQLPMIDSSWTAIKQLTLPSDNRSPSSSRPFQLLLADVSAQSIPYDDCDFTLPTILAVGSEATGISSEAMNIASAKQIEIPMYRPLESLNVGVAGGTILSEACRQRRKQQ